MIPPLIYYCYPCGKSWKPIQELQWRERGENGVWVSVVDSEDTRCPDCGHAGRAMRSDEDLVQGREAEM